MEQLEAEPVLLRWSFDQLAYIEQDRSHPVGLLKLRSWQPYTTLCAHLMRLVGFVDQKKSGFEDEVVSVPSLE